MLQREYDQLIDLAKMNELIYESEYNFVPRVGQIYHLYMDLDSKKILLSMIDPPWRNKEYRYSVEFTSDSVWKMIESNPVAI